MTMKPFFKAAALMALALGPMKAQTYLSGNQVQIVSSKHTADYTATPSDCGKLLSFSSATSVTLAIPAAGSGLVAGCWFDLQNIGPGALTVAPLTSTIDGAPTLQLKSGQGLHLVSDSAGYLTVRGNSSAGWTNISVTGSPAPVFAAGSASGITFTYTLAADVTGATFTGASAGLYVFSIKQDSTGGHAFAWPPNVKNAPAVDPGADNTTYLQCQFDGANCVAVANGVDGPSVTPAITVPGRLSGSNTIVAPADAGTGSTTNLAPNGTTVIPNACTGQVVQSVAADGSITCAAAGGSGAVGSAGLTIPGATSGSNTIKPAAIAGTGSTTNLALNGTTVIPNACTGQVVQSIAADGTVTCASVGSSQSGGSNISAGSLVPHGQWAPFGSCLASSFSAGGGFGQPNGGTDNSLTPSCSGPAGAGNAKVPYVATAHGTNNNELIYVWRIPSSLDFASGVVVGNKYSPGDSNGGNAVYSVQTACMDGQNWLVGATPWAPVVRTTVTQAPSAFIVAEFTQSLTQTNGLLACAAGSMLYIKINRLGADAADTANTQYLLGGISIRWKEGL